MRRIADGLVTAGLALGSLTACGGGGGGAPAVKPGAPGPTTAAAGNPAGTGTPLSPPSAP
jgi:hypothetical protein